MEKENNIILRPATIGDARHLFEWRNDPETRMQSINTEGILWGKHLLWLKKSLASQSRKIIMEEIEGQPVGTVRLDITAPRSEISWIVAPSARGRGLGMFMVQKAVETLNCSLLAHIKPSNPASMKIAKRVGFHKVTESSDMTEWIYDL